MLGTLRACLNRALCGLALGPLGNVYWRRPLGAPGEGQKDSEAALSRPGHPLSAPAPSQTVAPVRRRARRGARARHGGRAAQLHPARRCAHGAAEEGGAQAGRPAAHQAGAAGAARGRRPRLLLWLLVLAAALPAGCGQRPRRGAASEARASGPGARPLGPASLRKLLQRLVAWRRHYLRAKVVVLEAGDPAAGAGPARRPATRPRPPGPCPPPASRAFILFSKGKI